MGVQSSVAATREPAGGCWHHPPDSLFLNQQEVHVWRIPLDVSQYAVMALAPLLSDEENARAGRILCEDSGRRFVAAHGALRRILSRYLDESPDRICLVRDARGKPHLASGAGAPALCFSLSHSDEVALVAVTQDGDVGVDVERIRQVSAWREIAARYFSEREREALCSLADDGTPEAFFHCWTRKEAYSKALGRGVSQLWREFSVSLATSATTVLHGAGSEAGASGQFTLRPLDAGAGYVAAVAAPGVESHLCHWQWSWA